jgi:predicted signal transduction protein with EAL and GGDEF domain
MKFLMFYFIALVSGVYSAASWYAMAIGVYTPSWLGVLSTVSMTLVCILSVRAGMNLFKYKKVSRQK